MSRANFLSVVKNSSFGDVPLLCLQGTLDVAKVEHLNPGEHAAVKCYRRIAVLNEGQWAGAQCLAELDRSRCRPTQ